MKNVKWIENAGGFFNVCIGFCPSEKAWHKELKKLNSPVESYPNSTARCCFFPKTDDHEEAIIICIPPTEYDKSETLIEVIGLLVHESVHAVQRICELWGEDNPSAEFQAYTTQYIFQGLYKAFLETRRPGLLK